MLTNDRVIFSLFDQLPESRRQWANFRYPLNEIVVIALCGTIANCETWEEVEEFAKERKEWFEQYLELKHGIPSHDTIGRVIAALDTAKFFECLQQWVTQLQLDLKGKGVHIDGKTVRRSGRYCYGKTPMQTFKDSKKMAKQKKLDQLVHTNV
ncbi:MAG: ISAs1 family transposase [Planctomycetota bacterium]